MGDFKRRSDREDRPERRFQNSRPGRGSSNKDFARFSRRPVKSFSGERERPNRSGLEMHDVICDRCGKDTQVPFKPTSSKPVYCIDCFRNMEGASGKNDSEQKGKTSNSSLQSDELKKINMKLDKIMKALKIE